DGHHRGGRGERVSDDPGGRRPLRDRDGPRARQGPARAEGSRMKERHVLSVLVENRFGELARVIGLFAGRGFNIHSLAVNVTMDPAFSRIVLTTRGSEAIVEQIVKQLRKLIRVKKVVDMSDERHLERELCVATVQATSAKARQELERIIALTSARVIAY